MPISLPFEQAEQGQRHAAESYTYGQKLVGLFHASIISYLPMDDLAGAAAADASNHARPGAYTGVALAHALGPTGKKKVPFWDGGNTDYVNWFTAGLGAAISGVAGGLMIWAKSQNAGMWTDGTYRRLVEISADGNNYIRISRNGGTAGLIYCEVKSGNVSSLVNVASGSPLTWFNIFMSWNKAANQFITYFNGAPVGVPQAMTGTWAGTPTLAIVGASTLVPNNSFSGWLCHALLLNRRPTAAEVTAANAF